MRKFLVCWLVLSFMSLTALSPAVGRLKEDEAYSEPKASSVRKAHKAASRSRIKDKQRAQYIKRMARQKLRKDEAWWIIDRGNALTTKASTFADAYTQSLLEVPFRGLQELGPIGRAYAGSLFNDVLKVPFVGLWDLGGGLQARATGLAKGGCRHVLRQFFPVFRVYDFFTAWFPLVYQQCQSLSKNPLPGFEGFWGGFMEELNGYRRHPLKAIIECPGAIRTLWIDAKEDLWPSLKTTFTKEALEKAGLTETGLILVNYALVNYMLVNYMLVNYMPVINTPVGSIPVGSMLVSSMLMRAMPVNCVSSFAGYVKRQGSYITGGLKTLLTPFARQTEQMLENIQAFGRGGVGLSFHP